MKALLIDPVEQTTEYIDVKNHAHLCSFLSYSGPNDPELKPVVSSLIDDVPTLRAVYDDSHAVPWGKRKYKVYSQVILRTDIDDGRGRLVVPGKVIIFKYNYTFDGLADVGSLEWLKARLNPVISHCENDVIEPNLPGIFD